MYFVSDHCRTRGKLVLLATVVVSLLHAATAVNSIATRKFGAGTLRRSLVDSDDDAVVPSYSSVTHGTYNYGRSDISYSHGGKGKGQSGLDKLKKCYETCTDIGDGTDEPTRSPTGSSAEKPPCCKGGVSFLKMIYRGNPGELLLPSSEGLSDFTGPVVNPCSNETRTSSHGSNKKGGSSSSGSVVKFVSCNQCLPDGTGAVSTSCDAVSDSVAVKTDTEVCMAAFTSGALDLNSKFPTNMDLYFLDEDGANMIATTLHTSCSKPIHSPWAARLDACVDDKEKFYVNLSTVGIASLDNSPVLEFVDGVSVQDPTALLTNCDVDEDVDIDVDSCCKGGASFLKVRISDTTTTPGIVTSNATLAASSDCDYDKSTNTVRFVSCSDECLDPLVERECTKSWDSVEVIAGAEICFGVWDGASNRVNFGSKMPTNLYLFFVPQDPVAFPIQSAELHTSCSRPIYAPYAQPFTQNYCDPSSAGEPVNLNELSTALSGFYLEFVDGVSLTYYEQAKELGQENGASFFDISFANCSCSCDAIPYPTFAPIDSPTAAPSDERNPRPRSPASIDSPPAAPTNSPAGPSTTAPSEGRNPGPRPPPGPCEEKCEAYVFKNCVLRTSSNDTFLDEPCDVSAARPVRLLETLQDFDDQIELYEKMVGMLSVDDQIEFHEKKVALLSELLSHLE